MHDEHFDAMLDAELRSLDAQLAKTLAAPPAPRELVDAVDAACGLAHALHVEPPAGLTDRVYEHTAHRLVGARPVLARLGRSLGRIAAALVVAVTVLGLLLYHPNRAGRANAGAMVITAAMDEMMRDADFAGTPMGDLDAQAVTLALEIDEMAIAMEDEPFDGLFDDPSDLSDELRVLEAETDVF